MAKMNKIRRNSKRKTGVPAEVNKLNSDCCRICLNHNNKMSNLFNDKLLSNIEYCTGVRITKKDSLPSKICKNCLASLKVAHEFKKLCLLSEEICKNLLESGIKEEPPDSLNDGFTVEDSNDNYNDSNGKESFKEDCLSSIKKVKEDIPNEHSNDSFNENPESGNDNFEIEIREKGEGLSIVKKEEVLCEFEASADNVQTSVCNDTKISSDEISTPRSSPKPVKKRGPYRKRQGGGPPARRRKFAYTRLFCEPCQIKFASKLDADQHRAAAHQDPFMCEVKFDAGRHRAAAHQEPHPFICAICGKMFSHRGSQYTHIRTHLPATHACDHCDYRSASKYDLAKHLLIHAGIRKWQCSRCPNAYFTVSNLRTHERLVHERALRHACDTCGKMFFDRTHLQRHIDSHNDVKRHECSVCHTAFTRRCYWKKHLLKQHSIVIPPLRPGRGRRTDLLIGDCRNAAANLSSAQPPAQTLM